MITLYHCVDARSFRCLWLLEEMQQPYQLEQMAFPPRMTAPDYLKINPTGSVPCMQDDGVTLFESSAILEYLATRYPAAGLDVAQGHPAYGPWLNWLHFGEASLTAPLATMLRYQYFEPAERRQPAVVADHREYFLNRLALVDAALQGHDYLVDNRFSAADVSVGYALMLSKMLGLHEAFPAAVGDYWNRLRERDGYKAAKAAQRPAA